MATILIVDDEPGFRQILNIVVRRAGHTPIVAPDVPSAQALLMQVTPDAIILDDDMPGTSGSEYCRVLKADPETASIPVIMYSANAQLQQPASRARVGADAVVKKPSMPKDITDAIDMCLSQRAGV